MSIPSDLELRFLLLCRALELPEPLREYVFAAPRRWRFDAAWPALKVAAELEGGTWVRGRHSREPGFSKDCEKYNCAAAAGWAVFRFTSKMLDDMNAVDLLAQTLRERSRT